MRVLKMEGSDDTPEVHLNKDKQIFEIVGRSLPEDVVSFYAPIVEWLTEYSKGPLPCTDFTFKLDYFNTASSKIILDLISQLKTIKGSRIIWYSYEDDEEVRDAGKEFSEQVDIPFDFRTM